MTNKEAIEILERLQDPDPGEGTLTESAFSALQMAIDKLKCGGEALNSCPFCGDKACLVQHSDDDYPWEVRCINITCAGRTEQWNEASAAIRAWNRRAE